MDWCAFRERIQSGKLHVGIVGLGHVGLPLALTFVERGKLRVTGFDIDDAKTSLLNQGNSYIMHLGPERVRAAVASGLFVATSDFSRLTVPDALIIAVPTPLTRQREPDMRYVVQTGEIIARYLRPGQLVVLESTSYPGTTEELLKPLLEQSGFRAGVEFLLAYSPEREDPGNHSYPTHRIPKLVGGLDPLATDVAVAVYRAAIDVVISTSNARTAEATKLTENIFRAVNIALVNELKVIYERMGIDIWDVLDAAATKPFGFMRFDPGPGLGGHCIPLDPFYLTWKAREYGIATRFIELAGEVNISMPKYVVERLRDALNARGIVLHSSRILILGVAYKRDVDDLRESPAFELMQLLLRSQAVVSYHDPLVPSTPRMRSWPNLPVQNSVALTVEELQASDAVVIVTDHSDVDYRLVLTHAPLIVDTRGVYRQRSPNVVKA